MRRCVIFNPAARGERAQRFRRSLDSIRSQAVLKETSGPGEARLLAAGAVRQGFETVIAAGGDGTLNEVLNGIGDEPDGFARARLGLLPLGTANVFALELGLPLNPDAAWRTILAEKEIRIDLPAVEYTDSRGAQRRYFAQMAGAGLDARAIQLVSWSAKKRFGALAYVIAGMQALCSPLPRIRVESAGHHLEGELVLIGNGRLYGGRFEIFPGASLNDGLLEVCVMPRVNGFIIAYCAPFLLAPRRLPEHFVRRFRASSLRMESAAESAFEVEGELAGSLPATFRLIPSGLRLIGPE